MAMFGPGGTVVELEAVKVNKTVLRKEEQREDERINRAAFAM